MKTVGMEKVLGIGGEGVVIRDMREIEEYKAKNQEEYKRVLYKLERKSQREVAIKFVKFNREYGEDLGTERGYFGRLLDLGDYKVATNYKGGYTRPYLDFGISEIFGNFYYAIGKQNEFEFSSFFSVLQSNSDRSGDSLVTK